MSRHFFSQGSASSRARICSVEGSRPRSSEEDLLDRPRRPGNSTTVEWARHGEPARVVQGCTTWHWRTLFGFRRIATVKSRPLKTATVQVAAHTWRYGTRSALQRKRGAPTDDLPSRVWKFCTTTRTLRAWRVPRFVSRGVTACWGASTCVAAFFLSCSLSETPNCPLGQSRTQAWLKNGLGCFRRRLSRNGASGQSSYASSASVFHASLSVANTKLSTKRVKTMTVGHDDLNMKTPARRDDRCTAKHNYEHWHASSS